MTSGGPDLTGRTLHVTTPDADRAALVAWILAHPKGSPEVVDALGLGDTPPGCCPVCGVEMRGKGACRSKACRSRKVKS